MSEKRCDCDCDCGAALEAEVERLKNELRSAQRAVGFIIHKGSDAAQVAIENARLLAEVERLKKYEVLADRMRPYMDKVNIRTNAGEDAIEALKADYDALKETT